MQKFISKKYEDESVESLKQLVSYASVTSENAAPGAPFGKNISDALHAVLKIAEDMGFETYVDPEGYYAYADYGEGDKIFGILGHIDVVPAGDLSDWEHSPFNAEVKDGVIYGRGVQDDKGPMLAAMYAIKALIDQGIKFKNKIRFIFGTDEEVLWRCINRYLEKEQLVDWGISPDGEFPLTYAEFGLTDGYLVAKGADDFELTMDNAFNAVPGKAVYNSEKIAEVKQALDELGFEYEDNGDEISVIGKAVHAKDAAVGVNAVSRLGMALAKVFPNVKALDFFNAFNNDGTGISLIGEVSDETGKLAMTVSSLVVNSSEIKIQIDMRIPATLENSAIIEKLKDAVSKFGLEYVAYDELKSSFVAKDSELVTTLMDVYKEFTGDEVSEAEVSAGASYARTMPNTVAYGAIFPNAEVTFHQVDEHWELSEMFKAMELYAQAFYRLLKA